MELLPRSVERLARLAQRDAGLAAVRRTLAEELSVLLAADEVHVAVFEPDGTANALVVAAGAGDLEYEMPPPASAGADALSWVATTGCPLLVPDARVPGTLPVELVHARGLACGAVFAVRVGEAVRGIVLIASRSPREWPPEALRAAGALVDVAGAAIALRDARMAAAIDPLTGCLNHGAMLERLEEEVDRARRQGTPLAAIILDLDDFKRVNDTYGHPTGDALLRHVGEALRHEYRSFDRVARYGGDEFVVVLPNVRGGRADAAAARALRLLRGIHIARADGVHEGITVSVGLAEWVPGETPADLLERADTALRESKAAGKDGVARAADPPQAPAAV